MEMGMVCVCERIVRCVSTTALEAQALHAYWMRAGSGLVGEHCRYVWTLC